jgi:CRP-like cAMP-binding protein
MSRQDDITAILNECPLFKGADAEGLRALAAISASMNWPAGTLIFQQGDASDFLGVIASGSIRLSITTAAGRELILRQAARGETIGEMGVLDHEPRSADATAITAAQGLIIQRKPLERVLAEHPQLSATVIRYLTRRLRETTYQLESVALYSLAGRLARFLLAAVRQAHGDKLQPRARITLNLGQSEIAAILGASRPKLNRAFAELADLGAIIRKDRELDCDVEALTGIAEADDA